MESQPVEGTYGAEPSRVRSGGVTFAAILAGVVGVWNILSGIAAISEDNSTVFENIDEVLYEIDLSAWGWFWLVVGILQVLTAYLIYARSGLGQVLGLLWAFLSASLAVFSIFVAPFWSLAVLALSGAVIYFLVAVPEEFEVTASRRQP